MTWPAEKHEESILVMSACVKQRSAATHKQNTFQPLQDFPIHFCQFNVRKLSSMVGRKKQFNGLQYFN